MKDLTIIRLELLNYKYRISMDTSCSAIFNSFCFEHLYSYYAIRKQMDLKCSLCLTGWMLIVFSMMHLLQKHEAKICHYLIIFICFVLFSWFFAIKIAGRKAVSSTEIELNIIDQNNIVSKINLSEIGTRNANYGVNKMKRKHHVPQIMLDLYEKSKRMGVNFTTPDIVRSIIPRSAGTLCNNDVLNEFGDSHLLIFDVPKAKDDEDLLNAELRVLTIVEANAQAGVERVVKLSVFDENSKKFVELNEFHVYHTNNTWMTFNITHPVFDLLKQNLKNNTLKIIISIKAFVTQMRLSSGHLKLSLMPVDDAFEHDYPLLLLSYVSRNKYGSSRLIEKNLRRKRNIEDEYEEESNILFEDKQQLKKLKRIRNTCRRKPLYVDFAEIRYDEWIVQPTGYEAYQCQGKCFYPVADHLNPTKHAVIQILLHSAAPSRVPRPCCVPTKLNSISILYVDEAGVVTYRYAYSDMVVAECGCR